MSNICSTHEEALNAYKSSGVSTERRNHLKEIIVGGRRILKYVLRKEDVRI
jgi:hypothetical protein